MAFSLSTVLKQPSQNRKFLAGLMLTLTLINVFLTLDIDGPLRKLVPYSFRSHTNVWAIEGLRDAAMTPEESVHYRLETEAGATEWASTLPQGKGIVSVPGKNGLFRLAMFHQLECLGVIRASMMDRMKNPSGPSTSEVAHFCLNYLRQSIQCHTDVHLEMVRSEYGGRAVLPYTTRTDCRDWEQVWHQAEGNFDVWSKRSLFNML